MTSFERHIEFCLSFWLQSAISLASCFEAQRTNIRRATDVRSTLIGSTVDRESAADLLFSRNPKLLDRRVDALECKLTNCVRGEILFDG